jgi:hypothetical protein
MAFLSPKGADFLQRILTNDANINPRAIVHNEQVYAIVDYSVDDHFYAVWTQDDLENNYGCRRVKKSEAPWIDTSPAYIRNSVFQTDDFSLDEVEEALDIIDSL